MREDRLNEIAVVVDLYESGDTLSDHAINVLMNPVTAVQLFREVRRLSDGISGLADEWAYKGEFGWGPWQAGDGPDFEGSILDKAASELRALLGGSEA